MKKLLYGIGIVSFVLGVACGIVGLFNVYPFQRFPWLFVIPAFLLAEGPQQCRRCGTQLPPGGKTCPTCHYVNE